MHLHAAGLGMRVLHGCMAILCSLLASTSTRADRPPRAPSRVESANGQFFAELDAAGRRITVFRRPAPHKVELWTMPGYHSVVFLSDQPDYLVTGHVQGCFINATHRADTEVLAFYRQNVLVRSVRLNELVRPAELRKDGSRYRWCEQMAFIAPTRFRVLTSGRRQYVFDVTTGNILEASNAVPLPGPPILESP
jgi:hypothetical protein